MSGSPEGLPGAGGVELLGRDGAAVRQVPSHCAGVSDTSVKLILQQVWHGPGEPAFNSITADGPIFELAFGDPGYGGPHGYCAWPRMAGWGTAWSPGAGGAGSPPGGRCGSRCRAAASGPVRAVLSGPRRQLAPGLAWLMCESVRYRGVPAHGGTDAGLPAGIGVRPSCFALRGPEQVKKPLHFLCSPVT